MAYEAVNPTLIANTTMQKYINNNGVFLAYYITPNDGYVIHDKTLDRYEDYDDDGNPIGDPILGYYPITVTCGANYDFVANPREFYTVLRTEVPENQIYTLPSGDHETI